METGITLRRPKIRGGKHRKRDISRSLFDLVTVYYWPDSSVKYCENKSKLGEGTVINHVLYMDDIKLYGKKKESELDQLVKTVRILSQDIGMEFGISKCALFLMKRGKFCQMDGIGLPNAQEIRALEEGEPTSIWGYWKQMK